jgi:CRISPR-associated protein Csm5
MKSLTRRPFDLYPLTALHVGGGATVEPYSWCVRGREALLLNTRRLAVKLAASGALDRFIEATATDLAAVMAMIEPLVDDSIILDRLPVSEGFEEYWRGRLGASIESLELTLFPRTMNGFYLPGSSIKGAIRTAFYTVLGQAQNYPPEWDVFGHKRYPLDASPFKRLKVADVDLGRAVEIAPIHGMKLESWTSGAPDVVRLLVRGNLERADAGTLDFATPAAWPVRFEGSVAFFEGYGGGEIVAFESLIAHTRAFAAAQMRYETDKPGIGPFYQWLFEAIGPAMANPNVTLLRVGFGGGRAATSVLTYAPQIIEEELARQKFALSRKAHPAVRKIAGQHPMGWALLVFREASR